MDIILVGHGQFASGLLSSLELIAGKQDGVTAVDFIEGMSGEQLEQQLKVCIEQKSELLLLCDLLGGTPFKTATLLAHQFPDKSIQVLSGTNLAMLLDVVLSAESLSDDFIEHVKAKARQGIISAKELLIATEDNDWQDGI